MKKTYRLKEEIFNALFYAKENNLLRKNPSLTEFEKLNTQIKEVEKHVNKKRHLLIEPLEENLNRIVVRQKNLKRNEIVKNWEFLEKQKRKIEREILKIWNKIKPLDERIRELKFKQNELKKNKIVKVWGRLEKQISKKQEELNKIISKRHESYQKEYAELLEEKNRLKRIEFPEYFIKKIGSKIKNLEKRWGNFWNKHGKEKEIYIGQLLNKKDNLLKNPEVKKVLNVYQTYDKQIERLNKTIEKKRHNLIEPLERKLNKIVVQEKNLKKNKIIKEWKSLMENRERIEEERSKNWNKIKPLDNQIKELEFKQNELLKKKELIEEYQLIKKRIDEEKRIRKELKIRFPEPINKMIKLFRIDEWYYSKASPIFFMFYYLLLVTNITYNVFYIFLTLVIFTSLSLAFGYALNDFADRKRDRITGKNRPFGKLSPRFSILILMMLLVSSLSVLYPFYSNKILIFVLLFGYLIALSYNLPPIRLKDRGLISIITESLPQRTILAMVVLAILGYWTIDVLLFLILFTMTGIRWAFVHQILNYESDKRVGEESYVVEIGKSTGIRYLKSIVFPIEIISLIFLLIFLSINIQYFMLFLIIYFIFHLYYIIKDNIKFNIVTFTYAPFYNFYFFYLPLSLAIILTITNPYYFVFVLFELITKIRHVNYIFH